MIIPQKTQEEDEEEEEKELKPSSNLHLIWDDTELDDIDDDIMEEACVGIIIFEVRVQLKSMIFPLLRRQDHQNILKILERIQPLLNPP